MDLTHLPAVELRELFQLVSHEISVRETIERRRALEEITAIARNIGLPINDLVHHMSEVPLRPKTPRYGNPANRNETWTGFGRKPRWLKEHLAAGNSLESALI